MSSKSTGTWQGPSITQTNRLRFPAGSLVSNSFRFPLDCGQPSQLFSLFSSMARPPSTQTQLMAAIAGKSPLNSLLYAWQAHFALQLFI